MLNTFLSAGCRYHLANRLAYLESLPDNQKQFVGFFLGTDADMQSLSRWEHCSVLHCRALAALLYTDEIHFLDTHRPAQRQLMGVDAWKSNREIEDQRLAGIAGVSVLAARAWLVSVSQCKEDCRDKLCIHRNRTDRAEGKGVF